MSKLGESILRGIALSLKIDKYYFDSIMKNHAASLRLCHYPHQPHNTVDENNLGAGAHTG